MNLWQWLPIPEAAERLNIPARKLRAMADAGRISKIDSDGEVLIWLNDVFHVRASL
jgi:hypothetical protein